MLKMCKVCNAEMDEVISDGWIWMFVCPRCGNVRKFKNKWTKQLKPEERPQIFCDNDGELLELIGVVDSYQKYYCNKCHTMWLMDGEG